MDDVSPMKGSETSRSPTKSQLNTQKTHVVKTTKYSFNSSDIEAYKEEQPIPIVKEAYFEYQRNKRKAQLRRVQTMSSQKKDEQDFGSDGGFGAEIEL